MATNQNWLPRNHEALHTQASQTWTYLQSSEASRMGFGAESAQRAWLTSTFQPAYTAFIGAFAAWENPATRTPVISAALKVAQDEFCKVYRQLYGGFLRENPLVTDVDLVAMGLPERSSGTHTPASVPATVPEAEIVLPAPAVVEIHFRDAGATNRAKPAGVHGVEIGWVVSDVPVTEWAALSSSSFDTASPFRLSFDGADRGRRLYLALRWENSRGDKGPWSEILDAVIP